MVSIELSFLPNNPDLNLPNSGEKNGIISLKRVYQNYTMIYYMVHLKKVFHIVLLNWPKPT